MIHQVGTGYAVCDSQPTDLSSNCEFVCFAYFAITVPIMHHANCKSDAIRQVCTIKCSKAIIGGRVLLWFFESSTDHCLVIIFHHRPQMLRLRSTKVAQVLVKLKDAELEEAKREGGNRPPEGISSTDIVTFEAAEASRQANPATQTSDVRHFSCHRSQAPTYPCSSSYRYSFCSSFFRPSSTASATPSSTWSTVTPCCPVPS